MLSLTYDTKTFWVDAIVATLEYAGVEHTVIDGGSSTSITFLPHTPYNESCEPLVVEGAPSAFLAASRLAHTFPSNAADAGVVDACLRCTDVATLTELETTLSDGRTWMCADYDMSTAVDVLLHYRLKRIDLASYPRTAAYAARSPF